MDDTPAGSVHRKRDIFRRLKNTLRGSSRDRDIFQEPSTLEITTNPAAKSGSLNPKIDTSKTENNDTKDYWQIAYNELTESDRKTLATPFGTAATDHREAGCGQTKEILEQVVKATEAQYRENQNKNGIRATAHRILDSALSFQDVVSNVVRFDPTGYASSAWAIVSLGLTMAKNHADLQDALFETSGYLADLLTRCAFIEEQFYCGPGPVLLNAEKERSIVQVYVAILQYSAEVRRVQQFGTANDIVASITGVASKQLADLKTLIKKEESHLHHWLLLDQHLHRKVEAEAILTHIDELKVDIEKVRDAVNILNLPFADGAIFDSFIDQHEDECLSGTRAELLQQVQQWGKSSNKCIFWLSGMAGTGKTTIARTVARYFKEDGILGASFFFKRGQGDQGSAVKFFPTIVKQLAIHTPQMITGIQKALQNDPAISGKSLREQFDKLMLQPLLAMDQSQSSASTVIVIDALDECERDEDMEVILELLPKVEKATCLRIQFFLTSRPESAIRFGFDQIDQSDYQNTILQNLDNDVIKHDITLYLREEFRRIRQKRPRDLPSSWPGEERIEALATMAVPLFIFAATVCRFVADKRWNPERRLQQFFDDSPGSKMDKTYRPILNQLLAEDESDMDQLVEEFQKTIGVIILLATPLSLSALTQLVEMPEVEISTRLDAFHSVLTIPDKPNLPIQTLHLSFHDYLVDEHMKAQESTTRFWVDKIKNHEFIARQCLIVMGRHLKKNICRLPSYGTSRTEIDPDSIAQFLLPALQYTCRYWVYHLAQSSLSAKTIDQILPFLEEHFLHWLEVMAILGIISECLNAVDTLLVLTKDPSSTSLSLFLSDARRYIHKFMNIVDMAPLQLYSSGLIFAPQEALIKTNFLRELPNWLYRAPRVEENWSPELQTLEGHSDSVQSVAFSPDGQLLASVQSVAFSPDGQLLASGSYETIKLWDPATGALKHTISTDSVITNIEFSKQLPQLITNMGYFDIQDCYESLPSSPSEKVAEVSLAGRWVTIQGQRELWLPPDYQPCSSIVKSGTIAVGCANGRVVIIMFSIT
ncbi:hypothetical protein BDW67DRAFT_176016 [Aspergillus spinulosporus]